MRKKELDFDKLDVGLKKSTQADIHTVRKDRDGCQVYPSALGLGSLSGASGVREAGLRAGLFPLFLPLPPLWFSDLFLMHGGGYALPVGRINLGYSPRRADNHKKPISE